MYLRPLRTIFNEAIKDGVIKKEKCYPFGRRQYKIPASKNTKKALEFKEIKNIYYYKCDPKNESEQKAKEWCESLIKFFFPELTDNGLLQHEY